MDRRSSPPFALRLFYRTGAFHRPDEFASTHLPSHLTIHTWPSCSLGELSHHLAATAAGVLPNPAIGTRLSFRLVFADARGPAASHPSSSAAGLGGGFGQGPPPRFMVKDLGSIVVGDGGPGLALDDDGEEDQQHHTGDAGAVATTTTTTPKDDAARTLADARFVAGDYISVAILPPLADGSVAPASSARTGRGAGAGEAGTVVGRAPGIGGAGGWGMTEKGREIGFGGRHGRGGGRGVGRHNVFGRSGGVPLGEWRRGESLPDVPTGRGGRGGAALGDWRRGESFPDVPQRRNRDRVRF